MPTRRRRSVGFLGAGNMATAMVKGLLAAGLYRPDQIWATDAIAGKRGEMKRRFGIGWAPDNRALVRGSEVIVLAVKPQTLSAVLDEIRDEVGPRHLFVSIAAGFPIRRLVRGLGRGARIVRVMPNTPALLGKGMSVLVRGGRATLADERKVTRMLRAVGDAVAVRDEALLDPVTGLSGSGPAYVYLFAEALIEAGIAEGLPLALARQLVLRTLEGASAMLLESGSTPRQLREMVSSPGGTTLAGLGVLEKVGFAKGVRAAVRQATVRSRELGRES